MMLRTGLPVLVSCVLLAAPAHAAWPELGVPILPETTDTVASLRSLPDGAGGVFVVWSEDTPGMAAGIQRIKAQRFDADGRARWGSSGILIKEPGQELVAVAELASDGAGGFIVAWDEGTPFSNIDPKVFVQRVSPEGQLLWSSFGVRAQAGTADHLDGVVTGDGAQGAIVGWIDRRSGAPELYANRISADGNALWTITGRRIATAVGDGSDLQILAEPGGGASFYWNSGTEVQWQRVDGNGNPGFLSAVTLVVASRDRIVEPRVVGAPYGAVVTYQDEGSTTTSISTQVFGDFGQPVWSRAVLIGASAPGTLYDDVAVDPLSGDVVVAWRWFGVPSVRIQRLTATGTRRYASGGLEVDAAVGFGVGVSMDVSGDAILAWTVDSPATSPTDRVFAQRVEAGGLVRWAFGGREVGTAIGSRVVRRLVADPAGGAYVTMTEDLERGVVQRIEPEHGFHGRPAPTIVAAGDVPGDQGGAIEVTWNASPLDVDPQRDVAYYSVWRATDALLRGARVVDIDDFERAPEGRVFRRAASGFFWEYVGEQPAAQWPGYSFVVPTRADSTSVDDARTYVQVVAHTAGAGFTFPSAPDSARSTDDLAPAPPSALVATRAGTDDVVLDWSAPPDADLRDFRVYRSVGQDVAITPENLFATTTDTLLVDTAASPADDFAYRVVAVDVHENPSAPSPVALVQRTATGAPSGSVVSLRLRTNHPNPFHGRTQIRFAVPRDESVQVRVFDLAGRAVRTIDVRAVEGWNAVAFDGRDDAGAVLASGSYLYRVRTAREQRTGRLVLLR